MILNNPEVDKITSQVAASPEAKATSTGDVSLAERVLRDTHDDVRPEMVALMKKAGLREDDPLWLILVQHGYVESALHTMPHLCREVVKETIASIEKLVHQKAPEALKQDLRASSTNILEAFAKQSYLQGKNSVYGRPVDSYVIGSLIAIGILIAGLTGGYVSARLMYETHVREALILFEKNSDRLRTCQSERQSECSIRLPR